MPFPPSQVVKFFEGRDPHLSDIKDCLGKHCSLYHSVFLYKDSREKFLPGKWLVFILGTQCHYAQFPPLFGRGSSEPHLCHGSKPCLLEISPWMDMLWSLYWFLFFSFFWCQFLIVAVTKYHRLSVLIQHKFISQFWRSHVLSQFHWAKIQMLADVPSRSSKGESISFSFDLLASLSL